jgi:hypothetical protein
LAHQEWEGLKWKTYYGLFPGRCKKFSLEGLEISFGNQNEDDMSPGYVRQLMLETDHTLHWCAVQIADTTAKTLQSKYLIG